MINWHDATQEKPEDSKVVLVSFIEGYDKRQWAVGKFSDGYWIPSSVTITHWAEVTLPEENHE